MSEALDTAPLIDALREDERVHGVARLAPADGRTRLIIATTWDGRDALVARLPELARLLLTDAPEQATAANDVVLREGSRLHALTVEGDRLELRVERISDLEPSAAGEGAEPLLDPKGLLKQWAQWSDGRPRCEPSRDDIASAEARRLLGFDDALRSFMTLAPGTTAVWATGGKRSLRHGVATHLRSLAENLGDAPAEAALRTRIDDALRAVPYAAGGMRVDGSGARERFLTIADAEGFRGDRVLLDAAEAHVRAVSGRDPAFECGFALATFDQVEARYGLGEAVGGCKPPLVPGLVVGVAVTPADELALWAAPTLREPTVEAACVADEGQRAVVSRDAGKEALLGTLTDVVGDAIDALPALLRRARGAHHETPEDAEAMLRTLHLPRTFVLAAAAHGALTPGTTRLLAALALSRAAADMDPVVARKLELAAGRLLLGASESEEDCSVS